MMKYNLAIIGGGSAGYAAARTASSLGLNTALIEGAAEVGGLCILRGCMPSKALIESGNRMLTLQRAQEFGLRANNLEVHVAEIIARKRKLISEFANYRREQLETGKFHFIRGQAKFLDPHTIQIKSPENSPFALRAQTFLIATGSVVNWPSISGLKECQALTSDDALELTKLPSSLIVLGAGPVALEMAHYFGALGTKVTVIQRGPQILTGSDADLAETLMEALRKRQITIYTKAKINFIETDSTVRRVHFEHAGKNITVEATDILNALGRQPQIECLNLEAAKVHTNGGHIQTNKHQQTSAPHIFAAGDCCGPYEVVHIAVQQGELAARNATAILKNQSSLEAIDYRLKLYVVFTKPEIATVGWSEMEAREQDIPFRTATYPFNDHGKSLVMGETDGFVKLLANIFTGEILGGAVIGPRASDLIHEIAVAMHFRATAKQLAMVPHYHPTLSEIWTYPAEELATDL